MNPPQTVTGQLERMFQNTKRPLLSIFLTAGFPERDSLPELLPVLQETGVDFVEIGMPYSDPLADGPIIQQCSNRAIANGMRTQLLFDQVERLKAQIHLPLLWMGYWNTVLQFGVDRFLTACVRSGFSGVIIPDLPPEHYASLYRNRFEQAGIRPVFLIAPGTPVERIHFIDSLSGGFLYLVASAALTGRDTGVGESQLAYFERVAQLGLQHPLVAGFGIHDRESVQRAGRHCRGVIVGSAFLRSIAEAKDPLAAARDFVQGLR